MQASPCSTIPMVIEHSQSTYTIVINQQFEVAAAAKCERDLRTVAFDYHK